MNRNLKSWFRPLALGLLVLVTKSTTQRSSAAEVATPTKQAPSVVMNLWPDRPPNDSSDLPPEADTTKPDQAPTGGKSVIRLGNVSTPQIALYRAPSAIDTGKTVVICPGGGHHILAYDLEGTEVAEWLNSIGVSAVVLKYRVPFRDPSNRSLAAVQDAQRAMRLVRSHCAEWNLKPDRVGILGFSAGGEVAARVSLLSDQSFYSKVDTIDDLPARPDFSILIYPAYLADMNSRKLFDELMPKRSAPPTFFVHAWDDPVTPLSTLLLAAELRNKDVPCEVHMFAGGGHGYGLRHVDGFPITDWPTLAGPWIEKQ